jgi:ABC-type sugar transport system substrate-binding protein
MLERLTHENKFKRFASEPDRFRLSEAETIKKQDYKEEKMKKLSILMVAVLVAALVFTACGTPTATESASADTSATAAVSEEGTSESVSVVTLAMLPKYKGENYFDACKQGAEEAIQELNANGTVAELIYDGPPQDAATNQKQVDILEGWIAQGVDVLIVSPNDPTAIAPTLKKAMEAGIKVETFDADAEANARELFINQASYDTIGKGLVKAVADSLTGKGYGPDKTANVAMLSADKTDANQNAWIASIKTLLATDEYSWLKLQNEETDIYYPGADETKNQQDAATIISRMGPGANQIQAAIGLSSGATPALGAAYASAAEKPDAMAVTMTGLATPNALKTYILDETNPMDTGVLWNCMDLGYLSVMAGYQMGTGVITPEITAMTTTRLGERAIDTDNKMILLGDALIFDKSNVEQYNY